MLSFVVFLRDNTEKGNDWQITGAGGKAFCAGMDLVNWNKERKSGADGQGTESHMPPTGFGGLSNRALARKPVIAAVNGYALGKLVDSCMHHGCIILTTLKNLGGGTEMVMACNIVVATKKSKFGLPEGW